MYNTIYFGTKDGKIWKRQRDEDSKTENAGWGEGGGSKKPRDCWLTRTIVSHRV